MVGFAPPSKPVTLAPAMGRCQIKSELIQFRAFQPPHWSWRPEQMNRVQPHLNLLQNTIFYVVFNPVNRTITDDGIKNPAKTVPFAYDTVFVLRLNAWFIFHAAFRFPHVPSILLFVLVHPPMRTFSAHQGYA